MPRGVTRQEAQRAIDAKTKPPGSLGRLEELAMMLAEYQGTLSPEVNPARLLVFAGDHGVAAEGVSRYPSEVTAQMMANFAAGGAAACVMAHALDVGFEVIDVGVAAAIAGLAGVTHAKVRLGTANLATGPAMTPGECAAALEVGGDAARRAARDGIRTVVLGEMGIANTTAAAALVCLLTPAAAEDTVGRGTGLDDRGLERKREVVARAVRLHAGAANDPLRALALVGGLELAAMAGAAQAAAELGQVVVVDGYIATAAALAVVRMDPSCRRAMIFAHLSVEPGHRVALEALGAEPLLDLGLRLGEGTGALLAVPLLRAAAAILGRMATFESAGVAEA
jgi:nicotinate-nucleotide--dimethylbenzimidazole phosphoribosyltransferase